MFPRVTDVKHVKDHQMELHFADGTVAGLDFSRRIVGRGGGFAPLANVELFKQVTVDHEAGTLVWPNGVDFCPNILYAEAMGRPVEEMDARLEVV
jgi:hypothetical protein